MHTKLPSIKKRNINNPIEKRAKDKNGQFIDKEVATANIHMKRCSIYKSPRTGRVQ